MKNNLCILLLIIISFDGLGQLKGFYLTAAASKDFSSGNIVLGSIETPASKEIVAGTYGKGFSYGPGIGYMMNNHFGIELGYSFFSAAEREFKFSNNSSNISVTINSKMMRIKPALKFTIGEKLKPFAKFGIVIGVKPEMEKFYRNVTQTPFSTAISTNELDVYSGGTPIGFISSLGADWNISNFSAIFLELNLINQSWSPKVGHYTVSGHYNASGSVEFVDQVINNSPDKLLKEYYSFSSLGINVGMKFNLSKKKTDS